MAPWRSITVAILTSSASGPSFIRQQMFGSISNSTNPRAKRSRLWAVRRPVSSIGCFIKRIWILLSPPLCWLFLPGPTHPQVSTVSKWTAAIAAVPSPKRKWVAGKCVSCRSMLRVGGLSVASSLALAHHWVRRRRARAQRTRTVRNAPATISRANRYPATFATLAA